MDNLRRDYQATRAPDNLHNRLLRDYARRRRQPDQWLAPAFAGMILFSVGAFVITAQQGLVNGDPGTAAPAGISRLAALTPDTSSLSQLQMSALGVPSHTQLGPMPERPVLPQPPRS